MKALSNIRPAVLFSTVSAIVLAAILAGIYAVPAVSYRGNTGQVLALSAGHSGSKTTALMNVHSLAAALKHSALQFASASPSAARAPRAARQPRATSTEPLALLPYNTGEVVHVTDAGGVVRRGDAVAGQPLTFTVRLDSATNVTSAYIQFKDPDSKFQDAQGLEHKVFTTNTGSASALYNGGHGEARQPFTVHNNPTSVPENGAVGGYDGFYLTVGRVNLNDQGTNPIWVDTTVGTSTVHLPIPGPDPGKYFPLGQEYECQYVNAHFAGPDTTPGDYGKPFYLAGYDDQQPGSAPPARPEWLQLTKIPSDGKGGTLFQGTWTSPTSRSDYYLDVIAYDDQNDWRIFDNIWGFSTQPFDGSDTNHIFGPTHDILIVIDNALGQKYAASAQANRGLVNLRPIFYGAESYYTDVDPNILPNAIYFNVQPTGKKPTVGSGGPLLDDQIPVPEINLLQTEPGSDPASPAAVLNGLGVGSYSDDTITPVIDRAGQTDTQDGYTVAKSQEYSLWRILCRGAVPSTLLNSPAPNGYAPAFQTQPAVKDPQNGFTSPAADGTAAPTVPVATRCVLWVSPFTGDFPLNIGGSIADAATQSVLRSYVAAGGRLFVSGQDVASALTQNGLVNNAKGGFVFDVLNASLANFEGGSPILGGSVGNGNRISFEAMFNYQAPFTFDDVYDNYFEFIPLAAPQHKSPAEALLYLGNNYIEDLPTAINQQYRTDGALTELGPHVDFVGSSRIQSQIDTIAPQNGAVQEFTTNGAGGLIRHEGFDPKGYGYGSRVVFASFGLGSEGIEYYKKTVNQQDFYFPRNQRPNILHNLVSYLRTGAIKGRIFLGSSTSQGVGGAIVYVRPLHGGGETIPGPRQTFSAISSDGTDGRQIGDYEIDGLEAGSYQVFVYRPGYTRDQSPTNNSTGLFFAVEGDNYVDNINLNITPLPPGSISGKVTDANTGNGIQNATVTFTSENGGTNVSTTTDANGNYSVTAQPDTYTGKATDPPGYADSAPQTGIAVTSGQDTPNVNFKLTPAPAVVSGRVFDAATSAGLVPATVKFYSDAALTTLKYTANTSSTPQAGSYSISVAPGTYYVIASSPGYATTNPAVQLVVTPGQTVTKDFPLNAIPQATMYGLVQDTSGALVGGAAVTVTDSNQNIVAGPFTTTDASSAAPDGGQQNYSGSVAIGGPYTVTVTRGNATISQTGIIIPSGGRRVDFTAANGFPLPPLNLFTPSAKGYLFFSLPQDYSADSWDMLFGPLGAAPNMRSHVAIWNPLALMYSVEPTPPADFPHIGYGYWIKVAGPVGLNLGGTPLTAPIVSVPLGVGWNQIGVPSLDAISLSRLTFPTGGTTISFADASGAYHLVSPILYRYDTGTGQYAQVTVPAKLMPYQAYWIRAFASTTVNLPTSGP